MNRAAITVCVVEADESVRRSLMRLLLSYGYRALAFRNAAELLASPEPRRPGCVIAGGQSPEAGASLPGALRARGLCMPVILLVPCETETERREAKRAGVAAIFSRPVDGQALADAIAWALSGPHLQEP